MNNLNSQGKSLWSTFTFLFLVILAASVFGPHHGLFAQANQSGTDSFAMRHQGGIQKLRWIPSDPEELGRIWRGYPSFDGKKYLALGMQRLPGSAEWKKMEELGLEYQGFMPPLAYFIAVPEQPSPALLDYLCRERNLFAACDTLSADAKRYTELTNPGSVSGILTRNGLKGLHILLHPSANLERFKEFLRSLPSVEPM
ncbi:MAG: hypothetical protein FJ351_05215, partial [Sphingomonadales bacterium]|nr:hypothetical protein [Sphingomonadales bacterium]